MRFLQECEKERSAGLTAWEECDNGCAAIEVCPGRTDAWTWRRCERLLRTLGGIQRRILFEISGNREAITQRIWIASDAVPQLLAALKAEFPGLGICEFGADLRSSGVWRELFTSGALHGSGTRPENLGSTPFEGFLEVLRVLPETSEGLFRCEFEPVGSEVAARLELINRWDERYFGRQRFRLQPPSAELHRFACELEQKIDPHGPLFRVGLGIGARGAIEEEWLKNLMVFTGLARCDGRPLLSREVERLQPRFLFNARELSIWAHLLPAKTISERNLPVRIDDSLDVPEEETGVELGVSSNRQSVVLPERVRNRAVHVVGVSGCGKSTLLVQMFLQDVRNGGGSAFIDPHGDAIREIAARLPEEAVARTKFFSLDGGVPSWNPLASFVNEGQLVDDVLSALARISRDWGDRLEHVLRNGLLGLLAIGEATLFNLYQLTRQGSLESERLRRRIIRSGCSPLIRQFWERDFLKDYRKADLSSTRHKLARLFSGDLLSMFSQRANAYDAGEILKSGSILLVDLSALGDSSRRLIGSLWITSLMQAAMGRRVGDRTAYSLFVDECHLFAESRAYEAIIAQARKFGLRLCLAHQYLRQFPPGQMDALATAGAALIGRVDRHDAAYLAKDLMGRVNAEHLQSLEPFSFVGRWEQWVCGFQSQPLAETSRTVDLSIRKAEAPAEVAPDGGERFFYEEF